MSRDPHTSSQAGPTGPARRLFAVTPSDTKDLKFVTTGLYVGTAGDVAVRDLETGTAVVFKNVPAGAVLPIRVDRVRTTSTTAKDLVGLA